jgi:sugar phosphate isomerase/epimerase
MMIGTTSFALRYRYLDPATAPRLEDQLEPLRRLGVEAFQICENVRPREIPEDRWQVVMRRAQDLGMHLSLGCMTMRVEELRWHLERASSLPSRNIRVIFELDKQGEPSRAQVVRLLDGVTPVLQQLDMRLAIENHFDLSSQLLAEIIADYPAESVGCCLDVANSLRNAESPETVFDLLEDRAFFYHFKDYRIEGSNVGFRVLGAPLGQGLLDMAGLLRRVGDRFADPEIYVENWVPTTGDANKDAATDLQWLGIGINAVRKFYVEAATIT